MFTAEEYTPFIMIEILWLIFFWVLFTGKVLDPAIRKYLGIRLNVVIFWYTKTMTSNIKGHVRTGAEPFRWDYIRFTKLSWWENFVLNFATPLVILFEFLVPILVVLLPGLILYKHYPDQYEYYTFIYMTALVLFSLVTFLTPIRKCYFRWGSFFTILEPPPYDRFEQE